VTCGTEIQCILCEKESAKLGPTGSALGVCTGCANLSKDIFEKLSRGQTWIVRTNQNPRSCKRPYRQEESKGFYDSELKQLPKTHLTENTGELLVDLLEIKPSKRLIGYARKWIYQFPNHKQAPKVLSFWLKHFPSKESFDLAAWYLKQHEPLSELHWLILSVKRGKGVPRLDRIVSERLEQAPQDDIWSRCLDPYMARSTFANKLASRWLKLNEDNPNLLLMGFTYFADSPEVVAAVFKHFRKHGFSNRYNERELQALLFKARDFKMPILPGVIKFARLWLSDHAEHMMASHAHSGMIYASEAKSDIERAKQWFLSHKSDHSSFLVLNALMHQRRESTSEPDPFAIEQAKQLIRSVPVDKSPPALIGTLLRACPDDETIMWAKQTYDRTKLDWILIELVLVSADEKLLRRAEQRMQELVGSSIEHEMLYALLKKNPSNLRTKRLARQWLAKHRRHPWAKAIKSLL
jgi:hypothetical protein